MDGTNKVPRFDYCVYLYRNPLESNEIFYIGKGTRDRSEQLNNRNPGTLAKIKEIQDAGEKLIIDIIRDGLDEKTAYDYESLAIDLIGLPKLKNQISGRNPRTPRETYTKMETSLLKAIIDPDEAQIAEPSIIIRVNQLYRDGMSWEELYDVTRGIWPMSERRNRAKYAFAAFKGVVLDVFKIKEWHRAGTTVYSTRPNVTPDQIDPDRQRRWEFIGIPAEDEIREKYRLKSVKNYFKSRFPITYVKC
jgi:uncharacterized protein